MVKNIYIFLFNGFSDWEIAYLTPEINKSKKHNVRFFTQKETEVVSMGGLPIKTNLTIRDINFEDVSAVILPGGSAWENKTIQGLDDLLENLYSKNKTIAAICAATTFLADKGYLNTNKHTSNDLDYLKNIATQYRGEEYYQNVLSVTDNNIITANGTAPIEFAREIFKNLKLYTDQDAEKWFQLFKNNIWS